eukprot:scaffold5317_cov160-Amphora_coffeaeformis.AAC.15
MSQTTSLSDALPLRLFLCLYGSINNLHHGVRLLDERNFFIFAWVHSNKGYTSCPSLYSNIDFRTDDRWTLICVPGKVQR